MTNALGLLAFLVYILIVVGAAAGVTMLVVKFSPAKKPDASSKS